MFHLAPRATVPFFLLCLADVALAAGGHRTAGDTQRALQQLGDACEQLSRAHSAMIALDAGEPPRGQARDWANAPALLASAAEALKRSAGPGLPDAPDSLVSTRQLRSCATRADALARLERQQRSLQAGAQKGAAVREALGERLAAVQAAEETRRFLVKAAERHAGQPSLEEHFPWRWSDVEGPAAAALASASIDLRRHVERAERSVAEHRALASEAAGLLASYRRATDCALVGSWSGTLARTGAVSGMSVQLTSAGESWSGTVHLDGAAIPVKAVTLEGSAVSIGLSEGRGTLTGSLSADGRSLDGSFSSRDGLAGFRLRKQR